MFSDEGGIGTISSSSSVRRTRSSRGDFFRSAGVLARMALAGGAERGLATLTFEAFTDLTALAGLVTLAGLAFRAVLARLAGRLVGRLAEAFAARFAGLDLGRLADRRARAAGADFFRRGAFALAMTRPFGTLTVCR